MIINPGKCSYMCLGKNNVDDGWGEEIGEELLEWKWTEK